MKQRKLITSLVATTVVAIALFGAGCKKEEKTEVASAPAAAPAEQAAAPAPSQALGSYDFESGTAGWNQSVKGLKIGTTADQKHGGNSSLKISGAAGSGVWNFGASPQFNLEPGKQYKLTAWMYVDAWDKSANPPLMKTAIHKEGKWAANEFTNKYNLKKMKEWQMITGKVTAPADGNITALVSLEKGTQDAINGTVYLDDITVEPAQ